ncbi:MAG: glycosyltransferase [Lachnospiraceae bacterium]|nr:glycosyltransferase [Lachnospiraceae bacterium]
MKILFVGLTTHYTENLNYQGNLFNKVLSQKGYEILFLADTQCFVDGVLRFTLPGEYFDENGVKIIRVPYLISNSIGSKLKLFMSIYHYINDFKPDIIYCHSPQYFSVFDIIKYKNKHPNVRLYADTHTSFVNYKKGFFSYWLLYKAYYKTLYKALEPYLEKYFYIGLGEKEFSEKVYNADPLKMEFLPLSGEEITNAKYGEYKKEIREKHNISDDDIVLFHSGKLSKDKNTDWIINSVKKINKKNVKLIISGSIPEDNTYLKSIIANNTNIIYTGWISGNDLIKYLCASDLYCQPGAPSVTLQTAICSKTPILCYKHQFYSYLYDFKNIIWIENQDDIVTYVRKIVDDKTVLKSLKQYANENSYKLDTRYLLNRVLGV